MAKFLGVISNSAKSCNAQTVLEFSDLEMLSNFIYNETQNLHYEFFEKLKVINYRDVIIYENSKKLEQIHEYFLALSSKMFGIERETIEIENLLEQAESAACHMQIQNEDFAIRSNTERDKMLNFLVKLSEYVQRMECQLEESKELECCLSMKNTFSWTHRFIPFLDLHTKILLQIERKLSKISDTLNDIEKMFLLVHKRLQCAHYHKEDYRSKSEC